MLVCRAASRFGLRQSDCHVRLFPRFSSCSLNGKSPLFRGIYRKTPIQTFIATRKSFAAQQVQSKSLLHTHVADDNGQTSAVSASAPSNLNQVKGPSTTPDEVLMRIRLCSAISEVFNLVEECAGISSDLLDTSCLIAVLHRLILLRKKGNDGAEFIKGLSQNVLLLRFLVSRTEQCLEECTFGELAELSSSWTDLALPQQGSSGNEDVLKPYIEKLMKTFADTVLRKIGKVGKIDLLKSRLPLSLLEELSERCGDIKREHAHFLLWLLSQGRDKLQIKGLSVLEKTINSHHLDGDYLALSLTALLRLDNTSLAEDLCTRLLGKVKFIDPNYLVVLVETISTNKATCTDAHPLCPLLQECTLLWKSGSLCTLTVGQQASVLHSLYRTHHAESSDVKRFLQGMADQLKVCDEDMLGPISSLLCAQRAMEARNSFSSSIGGIIMEVLEKRLLTSLDPGDHIRLLVAAIWWKGGKIGVTKLSEGLYRRVSPLVRLGLPKLEPWELCNFLYCTLPVMQKYGVMVSERWQALSLLLQQLDQLNVQNVARALYGLMGSDLRLGTENIDKLLQRVRQLLETFQICSHNEKMEMGQNLPQLVDVLGWRGRTNSKEVVALLDVVGPIVQYVVKHMPYSCVSYLSILHQGLRNLCVANVHLLKILAELVKEHVPNNLKPHTCVNMYGVFPFYGISLSEVEDMLYDRLELEKFCGEASFEDLVSLIWQVVLYKKVPKRALRNLLKSPSIFNNALTADGCTRLKLLYLVDYASCYHPELVKEWTDYDMLRSLHVQCRVDMLQYDMLYGEFSQIGLRRLVSIVQHMVGLENLLSWILTRAGTVEPFTLLLNKKTGQLERWDSPGVRESLLVGEKPYGGKGFTVVGGHTVKGTEILQRHHLSKDWPAVGYCQRFAEVLVEKLRTKGFVPIVMHLVFRHQTAVNMVHTLAHSFTVLNHLKLHGWHVVELHCAELYNKTANAQENYVRTKLLADFPNLKLHQQ